MAFFIWGAHLGPTLGGEEGFDRQRIMGKLGAGRINTNAKGEKGRNRNHKIPRQRNGRSRAADQERKRRRRKGKRAMDE